MAYKLMLTLDEYSAMNPIYPLEVPNYLSREFGISKEDYFNKAMFATQWLINTYMQNILLNIDWNINYFDIKLRDQIKWILFKEFEYLHQNQLFFQKSNSISYSTSGQQTFTYNPDADNLNASMIPDYIKEAINNTGLLKKVYTIGVDDYDYYERNNQFKDGVLVPEVSWSDKADNIIALGGTNNTLEFFVSQIFNNFVDKNSIDYVHLLRLLNSFELNNGATVSIDKLSGESYFANKTENDYAQVKDIIDTYYLTNNALSLALEQIGELSENLNELENNKLDKNEFEANLDTKANKNLDNVNLGTQYVPKWMQVNTQGQIILSEVSAGIYPIPWTNDHQFNKGDFCSVVSLTSTLPQKSYVRIYYALVGNTGITPYNNPDTWAEYQLTFELHDELSKSEANELFLPKLNPILKSDLNAAGFNILNANNLLIKSDINDEIVNLKKLWSSAKVMSFVLDTNLEMEKILRNDLGNEFLNYYNKEEIDNKLSNFDLPNLESLAKLNERNDFSGYNSFTQLAVVGNQNDLGKLTFSPPAPYNEAYMEYNSPNTRANDVCVDLYVGNRNNDMYNYQQSDLSIIRYKDLKDYLSKNNQVDLSLYAKLDDPNQDINLNDLFATMIYSYSLAFRTNKTDDNPLGIANVGITTDDNGNQLIISQYNGDNYLPTLQNSLVNKKYVDDSFAPKVPKTISLAGKGGEIIIQRLSDINYTGNFVSQSYTNNYPDLPSDSNGSGYLVVISYGSHGIGGVINQYWYPRDSYQSYYSRSFNNNKWGNWVLISFDSNNYYSKAEIDNKLSNINVSNLDGFAKLDVENTWTAKQTFETIKTEAIGINQSIQLLDPNGNSFQDNIIISPDFDKQQITASYFLNNNKEIKNESDNSIAIWKNVKDYISQNQSIELNENIEVPIPGYFINGKQVYKKYITTNDQYFETFKVADYLSMEGLVNFGNGIYKGAPWYWGSNGTQTYNVDSQSSGGLTRNGASTIGHKLVLTYTKK